MDETRTVTFGDRHIVYTPSSLELFAEELAEKYNHALTPLEPEVSGSMEVNLVRHYDSLDNSLIHKFAPHVASYYRIPVIESSVLGRVQGTPQDLYDAPMMGENAKINTGNGYVELVFCNFVSEGAKRPDTFVRISDDAITDAFRSAEGDYFSDEPDNMIRLTGMTSRTRDDRALAIRFVRNLLEGKSK